MGNWLGGTHLGLTYGQVRLVSSDPSWPEAFQRLVVQLRAAALEELALPSNTSAPPPSPDWPPNRSLTSQSAWPRHRPDRGHHPPPAAGCPVPGDKGDGGGLLLVLED